MQKRRLGRIVLIIDVRFLGIGSSPESVLPAIADLHSTVPGLSSWLMHRYLGTIRSEPKYHCSSPRLVVPPRLLRVLIFRGVLEFLGFGSSVESFSQFHVLRGGIASRLSAVSFSAGTQRRVHVIMHSQRVLAPLAAQAFNV